MRMTVLWGLEAPEGTDLISTAFLSNPSEADGVKVLQNRQHSGLPLLGLKASHHGRQINSSTVQMTNGLNALDVGINLC